MKILLLEDNRFDADLITRSIKYKIKDASVQNVRTIAEALDRLREETDFSVLLLDLNLPDGNGLEVLVEMSRRKIDILTIVLTSVRDEEQAVIALKTGADDYFVKDSENFNKLPDILLHNLSAHKTDYKTVKVLDLLYFEHDSSVAGSTIVFFSKYAPHLKIDVCDTKEKVVEKLLLKESGKCKYQVLILDCNLPSIESLDFLKKIRQELKVNLPIVILTGNGNEQIAIQALKLGADEYIVKKDNYLVRLPSLIENAYKYHLLLGHKKILENSEKRYRLLAENVGDVIFTLDINLNFTYVSPSVNNIQGYTPDELIDKSIKETLTNESLTRIINTSEGLLNIYYNKKIYKPTVVELEMYKKDRTKIWTEVKISILVNEQNDPYGILGVTRDISIKKKYEQELIAAKEKAEENDRLKSAFLGNISHEIRTPMNGILGFAELLKTQKLDTNRINRYINAIEVSGKRMLNTLNDLMDISKIEAGLVEIKFSEFDLNKILEYQHIFFKPEADRKNIQLDYQMEGKGGAFVLNTDRTKLNAILENLIKNAIKYTEKGSIDFGYQIKEDKLEFYVRDTGIGIPKDAQHKIFDRFVQANQDYTTQREGTGLGLSISKSYVDALGGNIWVESELNIGTTFYFTIPYIIKSNNLSGKTLAKSKNDIPDKRIEYKMKSLLIIDDDEVSQELLFEIFKGYFGKIIRANNGYEAIDICSKQKIDIILMDIKMPGLNGFEATREIRKHNKDALIIAQSAFSDRTDKQEAMLSGCDAYFTKPIIKKELFDFIEKKIKSPSFNQ